VILQARHNRVQEERILAQHRHAAAVAYAEQARAKVGVKILWRGDNFACLAIMQEVGFKAVG
jgi:hypothetical protein